MKNLLRDFKKHFTIAAISNIKKRNVSIGQISFTLAFLSVYVLSKPYRIQLEGKRIRQNKLRELKEEGNYVLS